MTLIQVETPPRYDESAIIDRLRDLYTQAKEMKATMASEWRRNYRITMNRAAPNVAAAPGTRANEVFPTVDSRIAWMTDQEIQFSITPAADPFSAYAGVTQTLGDQLETVLNSTMKSDGWYAEIIKSLWDSAMYGTGIMKCVWDAGLLGGMGNVALKTVSPWCFYPDPFATTLEDAQFLIEVHTMTPSEIERRFPDTSGALLEEVARTGDTDGDHIPPGQVGTGARTGAASGVGRLIPIDAGQGPTTWGQQGQTRTHTTQNWQGVNVYECWIKENYAETIEPADPTQGDEQTVICDQWRVIVFAGNRVLLDELAENLFHTDRHPYVRHVDVETGEFWGSPVLRDLAPCQQAMNTLLAMAQNNIIYTGNPMMAATRGSGADRSTFQTRPGQIFDVNQSTTGGQTNDPRWINPPNLPAQLLDLIGFWRDEMERIAGLSATQRGEVPSGRATDKQVQAGQEAGFVRIRSSSRNMEAMLSKAAELLANLIIVNFDTPRFVAIVGEEGEMTSIRLAAQQFYAPTVRQDGSVHYEPMRFVVTVSAGSSKPTSRAARMQEAIMLKQLGVVDDQFVLQAGRVSHWQEVIKRNHEELALKAQAAQAQSDAGGGRKGAKSAAPKPA